MVEIVKRGFEEKLLVFGGPGTGKTESVINKVRYLRESEHLSLLSNILILSFTRAAVQELQKRFRKYDGFQSLSLNICTFDEFCARLNMLSADPGEHYNFSTYNNNIKDGIRVIKEIIELRNSDEYNSIDTIDDTLFANIKHVIIDEVQDLNLSRAELVRNIFKLLDTKNEPWGFTLLGDINQEIFSFTQNDEKLARNWPLKRSSDYIKWVRDYYKDNLDEYILPLNINNNPRYLFLDPTIKSSINHITNIINLSNSPPKELMREINSTISGNHRKTIDSDQSLYEFVQNIKNQLEYHKDQNESANAAILFRSNRAVFQFSFALFSMGIEHRILLDNLDKIIPPWIAHFIHKKIKISREGEFILSREAFLFLWDKEGVREFRDRFKITTENAWTTLCTLLYNDEEQDQIDLSILYQKFSKRINEAILYESGLNSADIILSTIHKSKGREYDYVYMSEFGLAERDDSELAIHEEIRVLYVAITRCKRNFCVFTPGNEYFYDRYRHERHRLYDPKRYGFRHGGSADVLWWVRENIVDSFSFLDKNLRISLEKQDYIWNNIHVGDGVKLLIQYQGNLRNTIGKIVHIHPDTNNPTEIGKITQDQARKIVAITINRRRSSGRYRRTRISVPRDQYPPNFRASYAGVRVVAITSEMINPEVSEQFLNTYLSNKHKSYKFWLGFRIAGPLYLER